MSKHIVWNFYFLWTFYFWGKLAVESLFQKAGRRPYFSVEKEIAPFLLPRHRYFHSTALSCQWSEVSRHGEQRIWQYSSVWADKQRFTDTDPWRFVLIMRSFLHKSRRNFSAVNIVKMVGYGLLVEERCRGGFSSKTFRRVMSAIVVGPAESDSVLEGNISCSEAARNLGLGDIIPLERSSYVDHSCWRPMALLESHSRRRLIKKTTTSI